MHVAFSGFNEIGSVVSAMRKRSKLNCQDCRIVVFYRIAPERSKVVLPSGYRLREINGYGIGGIVLVRRPAGHPTLISTRLVAHCTVIHFVDVIRAGRRQPETGVLVMRYDTSSRLNALLGRGWRQRQHHARFRIIESGGSVSFQGDSDDRSMHVAFSAQPQQNLVHRSVFPAKEQLLQMLRDDLRCIRLTGRVERRGDSQSAGGQLQMVPLRVERLESSLFADPQRFPDGAAEFDSAYCLRDKEVVWSEQGAVCCDIAPA